MAKRKTSVKRAVRRPAARARAGAGRAARGGRRSWLKGDAPQIETYARKLRSFLAALADGVVDASEVDAQEKRLVALMKQIEPQLDAALHAQVTELLCELTAYDIMRLAQAMHATRPKTVFRG